LAYDLFTVTKKQNQPKGEMKHPVLWWGYLIIGAILGLDAFANSLFQAQNLYGPLLGFLIGLINGAFLALSVGAMWPVVVPALILTGNWPPY
jgi:hypothetical protein